MQDCMAYSLYATMAKQIFCQHNELALDLN